MRRQMRRQDAVRSFDIFRADPTDDTAGKSPSKRMLLDNEKNQVETHQVKQSNSSKLLRRLFGYDPDPSDIVGEYIATAIAREYLNPGNNDVELAPNAQLIKKTGAKDPLMASKYMNQGKEGVQTFSLRNAFEHKRKQLREGGQDLEKDNHRKYKLDSGDPLDSGDQAITGDPNILNFKDKIINSDGDQIASGLDKKSLYNALALSMAVGDHDFNPGNFMIVAQGPDEPAKVGRIDFGHAFNDLIKNWSGNHSPQYVNGRGNRILDTLNRSRINGDSSKLHRAFMGAVPDTAFAAALESLSDSDKEEQLSNALQDAKAGLLAFVKKDDPNQSQDDPEKVEVMKKSLVTLSRRMRRMSGGDVSINPPDNLDTIVNDTIDKIEGFVKKSASDAREVAGLIRVQALVDEYIQGKSDRSSDDIIEEIAALYKDSGNKLLQDAKGRNRFEIKWDERKIEWVKSDLDKKPFKGTINEYITDREKKLQAAGKIVSRESMEQKGDSMEQKGGLRAFVDKIIGAVRNAFGKQQVDRGSVVEQHPVKRELERRNAMDLEDIVGDIGNEFGKQQVDRGRKSSDAMDIDNDKQHPVKRELERRNAQIIGDDIIRDMKHGLRGQHVDREKNLSDVSPQVLESMLNKRPSPSRGG